jgi:hypothetical protein
MNGTHHHHDVDTVVVLDRFGRQAEGTLTREEWLDEHEGDLDIDVQVVRYHRDLVGLAA